MLSVPELISEAQRLSTRLDDKATTIDKFASELKLASERLRLVQKFNEEGGINRHKDNYLAAKKPGIVLGLIAENRQLQALEQENEELKALLNENQSVLDIVMHKYRNQLTAVASSDSRPSSAVCCSHGEELVLARQKVMEMAAIMRSAADIDDNGDNDRSVVVSRLSAELVGLREILAKQISTKSNDSYTQTATVIPTGQDGDVTPTSDSTDPFVGRPFDNSQDDGSSVLTSSSVNEIDLLDAILSGAESPESVVDLRSESPSESTTDSAATLRPSTPPAAASPPPAATSPPVAAVITPPPESLPNVQSKSEPTTPPMATVTTSPSESPPNVSSKPVPTTPPMAAVTTPPDSPPNVPLEPENGINLSSPSETSDVTESPPTASADSEE